MPSAAMMASFKECQRLENLELAKTSLWYLCTEVLHYDRFTEEFHRPMLDEMDSERGKVRRVLDLWPRGHYKTTVEIGQIIQDILWDPNVSILVCHAVDDEVQKIVQEVGTHFLKNKDLRALMPKIMPHKNNKRFLKMNQFTVNRTKYDRQPTLLGKSTNSEVTGAHCDLIYVDDIIGRNTIEDSGLPKVKSWFRTTVLPVLNPGGSIRGKGTRWDVDDIYGDWLKAKPWKTRVRAALETDEVPDYKGTPVLFGKKEISLRRAEMGPSDFSFQMMNDPSPAGEKPWNASECENYITLKELANVKRTVFVLSDPAPAKVGSQTGIGEQKRGDGSKDDWATAVIAWCVDRQRKFAVLLDGTASKDWGRSAGLDEICRMMQKWSTNKAAIETYGGLQADYENDMREAVKRNGTNGLNWIKFKNSYMAGAKNVRFESLSDLAREGRFFICESCPPAFVDKTLNQCRGWRPLPKGRNTNKFDDCADVVARVTDSALQEFSPQAAMAMHDFFGDDDGEADTQARSRYCGV